MNEQDANAAVRGLVFAVQKTRSDLRETIGGDAVGDAILEDLHPWVFGEQSVLPRLIEWQDQCKTSGVILGSDLFNFTKLLEMKDSLILMILPLYGYPDLKPDISWFTQTWTYLEDSALRYEGATA